MEMEKRKRVEKDEEEERERLKTKKTKEGDKEQVVPTEEEVEEFYAIVRRMQEAMKYFEKGNINGGDQGRRFAEGRWRAVMEREKETEEDEDEGLRKKVAGEERVVVVVENNNNNNNNGVVLDLNAEPVEMESST